VNVAALLPLVIVAVTQANPHARVTRTPSPPPQIFALPVISHIDVDVSKARVLVTHEIVMSRGEWSGGDVDLWVSFGPTMPAALDARLLAVRPGASMPDPSDTGEPIAFDKAAHRPPRAYALLGRSAMAGVVLHVREPAFRRAIAASGVLAIRVRQILSPPDEDEHHAREIVVRLGMEAGTPLTIRHIALTTPEADSIASASATLCGPNADTYILGFQIAPRGATLTQGAIDPPSATRRSTDDLCIRWVTR
jgi:hypothetical protein